MCATETLFLWRTNGGQTKILTKLNKKSDCEEKLKKRKNTKLKNSNFSNSNCDKTQKLIFQPTSRTKMLSKLNIQIVTEIKPKVVTKLKKNCDKTQKLKVYKPQKYD